MALDYHSINAATGRGLAQATTDVVSGTESSAGWSGKADYPPLDVLADELVALDAVGQRLRRDNGAGAKAVSDEGQITQVMVIFGAPK